MIKISSMAHILRKTIVKIRENKLEHVFCPERERERGLLGTFSKFSKILIVQDCQNQFLILIKVLHQEFEQTWSIRKYIFPNM